LLRHNCHINVEICISADSCKYITKYVFKGHDRTTLALADDQNPNGVKEYLDARYIGSSKSCWHIFEFPMHTQSPTIYQLPVHLEDQKLVYFNADNNADDIMERGATSYCLV
jgi:hypothetical protein